MNARSVLRCESCTRDSRGRIAQEPDCPAAPGYHINPRSKLVIESKADMVKRGEASLDDGDALALTFARPVAPPPPPTKRQPLQPYRLAGAYAPFG